MQKLTLGSGRARRLVKLGDAVRFCGKLSRRRDCHSAAPPSPFSRCFNRHGERVPAK